MSIRAIIFDFAGVYFNGGSKEALENLCKAFPEINKEKIYYIIRGKLGTDYRLGIYNKRQFWKNAIGYVGKDFDTQRFATIWHSSYIENTEMKHLVKRLRKNYKIGALSGTIEERVVFLENKYNFLQNFDAAVFSYELKTNKPNTRMYRAIIRKLEVHGNECIFVDDLEVNLESARKVGMNPLKFVSVEKLIKDLKSLGIRTN